jgi:hypothetical protein
MATVVQVPANKCFVEVFDGISTWTQIGGLNSLKVGFDAQDTDTTTFDNAGWQSKMIVARAATITAEGFLKVNPATGAQDAGQAAVEALGIATGVGSIQDFRMTIPKKADLSALRRYSFSGTVALGDQGGGNNDLASWSATVSSYGTVTRADI